MQNTNEWIKKKLQEYSEEGYRKFTSSLLPGVGNVLGIRLPLLRKMAKELAKGDWKEYLEHAKDDVMEETMLQGMVLGYVKASFAEKAPYLECFVQKINNWSVCDSTCAGMKPQDEEDAKEYWNYACRLLHSNEEFKIRFGVVMMLDYFITENYVNEVLKRLEEAAYDGYYVKMAVAWAMSVCYVKFPKETLITLQNSKMDDFTYNKAIQKMIESNRVSVKEKEKLRLMKRKKQDVYE